MRAVLILRRERINPDGDREQRETILTIFVSCAAVLLVFELYRSMPEEAGTYLTHGGDDERRASSN